MIGTYEGKKQAPIAMTAPILTFVVYETLNSGLYIQESSHHFCIPFTSTRTVVMVFVFESVKSAPDSDKWKFG
jgi:hypothetical protein